MGEARVKLATNHKQTQLFVQHLLRDVKAIERMLDEDWFESDVVRIGAEQELCLVDKNFRPAPTAMEILAKANPEHVTSELAKFNIEINMDPMEFKGDCLSAMENQISDRIEDLRKIAKCEDTNLILIGILPTIRKFDLEIGNITPQERYYAICKAINKLRGSVYELKMRGIDELHIKHDSPLLEACNTGFQVHMQVSASDFVKMYNISQAIAAPVLASAVNSPVLLGKRLWNETRIALFQQSIDTRSTSDHLREASPRVTYGNDWLHESVLEIYKEDIVRYRVLLSSEVTEDVQKKMEAGEVPELAALKVHNGTVYRWNRPCYGVSHGKAHLRIENRILPSGPTVIDEVANAAFWLGLMNGMKDEVKDIRKEIEFDDAKLNFLAVARLGLDTHLKWFGGKKYSAADLISKELLPLAEEGLKKAKVDTADIDKYLDIIKERTKVGQTGASWMLNGYSKLIKQTSRDEVFTTLVSEIMEYQKQNIPVHHWKEAYLDRTLSWEPSSLLVEEFMTTDLFTVQPDDILALVAEMIDWQKIRYVPVEDKKKKLVGLVTSRLLLRQYNKKLNHDEPLPTTVKHVMIKQPITVKPDASILEAMSLMEKYKIGCLPVVKQDRLVGIITEGNFLTITKRLLTRMAKFNGKAIKK